MKNKQFYFIIIVVILVTDQLTKLWATAKLLPVGSMEVIEGLFRLSYARNRGVAFSLFADSQFEVKWVFSAISALAALAVFGYLVRTAAVSVRLNLALALLLAGITGNLIDRVRLGEVVDFLDFHWFERFTWPTFNVADAAICVGAVLLALEMMKEERAASHQAQAVSQVSEQSGVSSSE
ncbi:MAG TPA: signal peptidase II [Blastocatellia bacterium]|nr:signal peptidase II [Blastocatellia bacterium]